MTTGQITVDLGRIRYIRRGHRPWWREGRQRWLAPDDGDDDGVAQDDDHDRDDEDNDEDQSDVQLNTEHRITRTRHEAVNGRLCAHALGVYTPSESGMALHESFRDKLICWNDISGDSGAQNKNKRNSRCSGMRLSGFAFAYIIKSEKTA